MVKKKNENEEIKNGKEMSFFEKYKNDKKYKAKVELIGYGAFIVILIIYLNIASMGNRTTNIGNTVTGPNLNEEVHNSEKIGDWVKKIGNNYDYQVQVTVREKPLAEGQEGKVTSLQYTGKRYEKEVIINKVVPEGTLEYAKVDSVYYQKGEVGYSIILEKEIYSVLEREYLEFDAVQSFLEKASLDHVTKYSSGKQEYVYHLLVRDWVKTHQGEEQLEFTAILENDGIVITVDYAPLFKVLGKEVLESKVEYRYQNLDKVEKFQVIEDGEGGANHE